MDLWIRSQDKRKLLKCNDIAVEQNMIDQKEIIKFEGYKVVGYFDKNTEYEELGIYATKERALEVLDEIQGKITQNECLKTMIPKLNNVKGEEEKIGKLFKEMVYEMPEE